MLLAMQTASAAEMVAIAGEEMNMRTGPGTDQPVEWTLGSGYPLEVIVIVRANKGTDQQINVRREPSTSADIVAKANYGVVFKMVGTQGTWIKVEHAQGVVGWVEGSLLWGK
jgi:SH3-like domain-containing protein